VLSAFSTFMGVVLGKEVRSQIKRTRMRNELSDYEDHIVLCGFGAVGEEVGRHFHNERKTLVVIERNEERADVANHAGYFVIQGDCTEERVLREAGVERAAGLIATLDSDASNVFLILMARELNPAMRIVARAGTDNARLAAKRAGADRVIVPGVTAGTQLSQLILKPRMSEFMAATVAEGEYDFAEIDVANYPGMIGKTLRELDLPKTGRTIIISIVNAEGEQEFSPRADRVLDEGDTLLVVSSGDAKQKLASTFQ
jgi:voltage-gated potassium channel